MELDSVKINFSEESLFILNICLAFLMFGVALDIKRSDFLQLWKQPRTAAIGLISEYLFLPILTIILIYILRPQPGLAMGMILVSCCPGGNVSNFMVHLAKANAALSVILTSITTLGAILITPAAFWLWTRFLPDLGTMPELSVEPVEMFLTIIQLILIPVFLGMFINEKYENIAAKLRTPVRWISLIIFFGFVVGAIIANTEFIMKYLQYVFYIVLIHNSLAFLMGYSFAKLMKEAEANARAVAIETGIQNTGLGLILVFNFFDGLGGMAMILACWGVWHLISGFGLAMWWRRKSPETAI